MAPAGGQPAQTPGCKRGRRAGELLSPCPSTGQQSQWLSPHASDCVLMLVLGQAEQRWLVLDHRRKAAGWHLGLVMALNVSSSLGVVPLYLKGHFSIPLTALELLSIL